MAKTHSPYSLRRRFFARFVHTFLQVPWLWDKVIDYQAAMEQHSTKLRGLLLMVVWFWPRLLDAEQWRDAKKGARRDPEHFVAMTSTTELLGEEVARRTPDRNAPILDLGCNCGRILNALRERGYANLHGVDISLAAREHMGKVFPELAAIAHYSISSFQQYLAEQPDGAMETIYSHGATLEVVHPSFSLVRHLCRVARSHVVLILHETGHSYPRFWEWEFNRHGFILAEARRPATDDAGTLSLLVFSRA